MIRQSREVLPFLIERLDLSPQEWLLRDLQERTKKGVEAYGVRLHTHNGRDASKDALEEAEDLLQYVSQALMEGGHNLEPVLCVMMRTLDLIDAVK